MHVDRQRLRFDVASLLARFRSLPVDAEATVSIRLPGLQITAKIDDVEKRVARELVIRLSDKRVLNAQECCDGCIDGALASLQEIRQLLVDKQVELAKRTDQPLYLLLELMAVGIRQFLTFEQRLGLRHDAEPRSFDVREDYFAALEALRAHIYRTMIQVAAIADVEIPTIHAGMRYDEAWDLEAYVCRPRSPAMAVNVVVSSGCQPRRVWARQDLWHECRELLARTRRGREGSGNPV